LPRKSHGTALAIQARMHHEFEQALLELIGPGLRFHALRPWRLRGTYAVAIDAPSLALDEAVCLIEHGRPQLLLAAGEEEDPLLALHFPRLRAMMPQHRIVYERAGWKADATVPFPARPEDDAHVPICAADVRALAACAEAISALFETHGERTLDPNFSVSESRVVRGHRMHIDFPLFTMEFEPLPVLPATNAMLGRSVLRAETFVPVHGDHRVRIRSDEFPDDRDSLRGARPIPGAPRVRVRKRAGVEGHDLGEREARGEKHADRLAIGVGGSPVHLRPGRGSLPDEVGRPIDDGGRMRLEAPAVGDDGIATAGETKKA
jgi:hypothetical protein